MIFSPELCAQNIYAEFLGNSGGLYSINYEHVIKQTDKKVWGVHGGFSFYRVRGKYNHFSKPIGFTYWNRPQGKHHAEFGICLNYIQGLRDNRERWDFEDVRYTKTLATLLNVGYRFQKPDKGFLLKVYYAPALILYEFESVEYVPRYMEFYPVGFGLSVGSRINLK
ncbi:hypothetical protein DQQ10_13340 [Pseudochryseolinea flava]|uniref:DUF3575 domain-containing protein n=1 Tax=Pseudochryseolinea flava TaxID=2059302 RepID=A0A364Y1N7_9BACT|nr:hypothetical protein DQQ10_13340 [Pseudochryseolinea flava]